MKPDFEHKNLFCRVNVQADKPFPELVSFVALCADGTSHMNAVRSKTLDISVFENDDFDAELSSVGNDRWLYFRYTLEIDPISGIAPRDYVKSIGELLKLLWVSDMDAVAACDFEEHLPRNVRRLKWARSPQTHGGDDTHAVVVVPSDVFLDACLRMVHLEWPEARFEDVANGKKYHNYGEIPLGCIREILAFPDARAEAAWNAGSLRLPRHSMLHIRISQDSPLLSAPTTAGNWPMVQAIQRILTMDILHTHAEAA